MIYGSDDISIAWTIIASFDDAQTTQTKWLLKIQKIEVECMIVDPLATF